MRFSVLRGLGNFAIRIPSDSPGLVQTTLSRLVSLMAAWRACLVQENSGKGPRRVLQPEASFSIPQKTKIVDRLSRRGPLLGSEFEGDSQPLDFAGIDGVGLVFLCSADVNIRKISLEILRNVRALKSEILGSDLGSGLAAELELGTDPSEACVIDVLEEMGVGQFFFLFLRTHFVLFP